MSVYMKVPQKKKISRDGTYWKISLIFTKTRIICQSIVNIGNIHTE